MLSIPELLPGLRDKDNANIYRMVILSKLLGNQTCALYWDLNRDTYRNNLDTFKNSMVNFIFKTRFNYANKHGLCESVKQAHWYHNPGTCQLRVPRAYALVNNGDPEDFIYDFKITAAMSLLKWIIVTHESNTSKLISTTGKVPIMYFHFALQECTKFAQKLRHIDIDKPIMQATENEWQIFFDYFYKAVHVGNHFKETNLETEMSMVHKSKAMLKVLDELWPFLNMDGYMNIWILKPSYGSRGIGIHFCRTLQYVLKVLKDNKNNSYVIQKYIERPLLIHKTKFDIRQWFLISTTLPLTIWIWKECYLRFSSQTYNLRKLHESIHLTNNSVQTKYHNGNRDPCLPAHNMWNLTDFKEHLASIGYPKVFDEIIFPGMKECITAAILINQDQIIRTPKNFELYGADFMLTEDFQPWLIEINSKPALYASTPVTGKLCPAVLEDVVKVIVDNARNPKAPTGRFELLYKEQNISLPQVDPQALQVRGQPIDNNYFLTPEQVAEYEKHLPTIDKSNESINIIKTTDYMKYVGKEMKKTLKQLLNLIETEKERRKKMKEKHQSSTREIDLESYKYCEEMEKIKSNMKEIQEIFLQDETKRVTSDTSTLIVMDKLDQVLGKNDKNEIVNIAKASDTVLNENSSKIQEAIITLNKNKGNDKKVVSGVLNTIGSLKFPTRVKSAV